MTSIGKIASQIIQSYDRNGDGKIQLKQGRDFEGARYERSVFNHYNYDEIIISRVTNEKLFRQADANGDNEITHAEMKAVISLFDSNNDGKLKNRGPFWNRKGERRNFDKAYSAEREIVDRRIIYKPQPPQPPYHPPHHPFPRALGGASVGVALA